MPRKTDDQQGRRKVPRTVSIPPDLDERVDALTAASGQDRTKIIVAALRRSLPAFEKDHGEMLRSEKG